MERLTERGKRALDLQGLAYRTYNGIAFSPSRLNVNGRILIDEWGYHKYYLNRGQREKNDPGKEWTGDRPEDNGPNGRLSDGEQAKNKNAMLQKPEELAFMFELVGGFSLKHKQWRRSCLSWMPATTS